jgi:hypothetical protein
MCPVTTGGKIFDCFFIILGLPVVGYSINVIPSFVASVSMGLYRRLAKRHGTRDRPICCSRTVACSYPWAGVLHSMSRVRQLILGLCIVVVYALSGAAVITYYEDWTYDKGVYFAVITLTTGLSLCLSPSLF